MQVQANDYPFGYVLPASGTPVITDAIAIVHGAKHPSEAGQFYEFVTTRESMLRQAREFASPPGPTSRPATCLHG